MTRHYGDVWFPWLQGPEGIMQCAEDRNSLTRVLRFSEFRQGATETCVKVSHASCFRVHAHLRFSQLLRERFLVFTPTLCCTSVPSLFKQKSHPK